MKLSKVYEPKQYEPTIYGLWESTGSFRPTGQGEPYTIVMPPPNANGNLHMGHAMMADLEDILIRYYRMQGRDALYIPGADHAGFETWVVYERQLNREGKSRFDFSREELYTQVWDFVEKQRGNMELQLRALGASASWEHLVFTLDRKVIDTAYATFKRLWDDGLVYRGERIVNYCTTHQTAFADIEVEHREDVGKLWKIAYPLLGHRGEVVVATTRPETMLGDTAIAVHPEDERYKHLIGSHVQVPIVNREIPIIGDEAVDPTFGTGAVKITPAHDPVDWEIGQRHQLPAIQVIGYDGLMGEDAPDLVRGLDPIAAREKVLTLLRNNEQLRGEEDYRHNVGHCYKCGTIIQPLIKDQWFLSMKSLADRAIEAISKKEMSFVPASKGQELIRYLRGLKDWNLSRQIPWGIPIPAFQSSQDHTKWIFDTRVDQETIDVDGVVYHRENDTFDTWFSSGQWPFIVTDYLSSGELAKYYPTDVMETGHDILYSWVSRMIMLGLYATDQVPFRHVYLHGMVLDPQGQKMSKSKGNVLNPMEMIDRFGSDALRLGIVASRSAAQGQAFASAKVIAGRNFCNKLWNIARFIEDRADTLELGKPRPETIADHWVVRQLMSARDEIDRCMADYRFAEAVEVVYHTIWDDVADWYLEASKLATGKGMHAWVLETCLKLAHPFAPFVTETIWTTLKWSDGLLIREKWPRKVAFHEIAAAEFDQLRELVTEARYVAGELPGKRTLLYEHDSLIADNIRLIARLSGLQDVSHVVQPRGLRLAVPNREAWIDVDEVTLYEHQTKLELRLVETRENIECLRARLENRGYVEKAPAEKVAETRTQLETLTAHEQRLIEELEVLK